MRRIDRETGLGMPPGVFYFKESDRQLSIKRDTVGARWNDWYALEVAGIEPPDADGRDWADATNEAESKMLEGASMPLLETVTRDALFDQDETFFVFEAADLLELQARIDKALSVAWIVKSEERKGK